MSDIKEENMRKTVSGVLYDIPFDITLNTMSESADRNSLFATLSLFSKTGMKEFIDKEMSQSSNIYETIVDNGSYPDRMDGMYRTTFIYDVDDMINADGETLIDNVIKCASDIIKMYRSMMEEKNIKIDPFIMDLKDMEMYVENGNGETFFTYTDLRDDILDHVDSDKDLIRAYLKDLYGEYQNVKIFDEVVSVNTDDLISFIEDIDSIDGYYDDAREWLENESEIPDPFEMRNGDNGPYYLNGQAFEFELSVDSYDVDYSMPEYTVRYNSDYVKVYDDDDIPDKVSGFRTMEIRIKEARERIFRLFVENITLDKLDRIIKILEE